MSKFSGKCDFADTVGMYGIDSILKARIYIGDVKLVPTCEQDLIPFYPHIVSSMASHKNEDGTYDLTIRLCKESYVETKEKEYLSWMLRDAITCAKELKLDKKHKFLDYEKLKKFTTCTNREIWESFIRIFNNNPDMMKVNLNITSYDLSMAQLSGIVDLYFYGAISIPICDMYREELLKYAEEKKCDFSSGSLWRLKFHQKKA